VVLVRKDLQGIGMGSTLPNDAERKLMNFSDYSRHPSNPHPLPPKQQKKKRKERKTKTKKKI